MTFGELAVGDHFVLANHFETFNGRFDVRMTSALLVYRKIEERDSVNAAEWEQEDSKANTILTPAAPVIKLVKSFPLPEARTY